MIFKKTFKNQLNSIIDNYEVIIDSLPSTEISEENKKLFKVIWLESIKLMEVLCFKNIRYNDITNVLLIVSSAAVPVIINIDNGSKYKALIATILSSFVVILNSIKQSYRFHDKWKNFRKTSEALKVEGANFLSKAGKYKNCGKYDNAFSHFAENIALIKDSQINYYLQKIVKSSTDENPDKKNKTRNIPNIMYWRQESRGLDTNYYFQENAI